MSDVVRVVEGEVIGEPTGRMPVPPVLPAARLAGVSIRPGVAGDYEWMDALQKANSKAVGFMHRATLQGHLEKGNVLVAEATEGVGRRGEGVGKSSQGDSDSGPIPYAPHPKASSTSDPTPYNLNPTPSPAQPVGYVLGVDRYLKRDELGVIYQMCVAPEYRRSLVAANLLKAKFEAGAYGCRLYCCWCAQDLAANRFWEAMGFVPLAFRTGGGRRKKDGPRMHIFWQKRIREGDNGNPAEGGTPFWFPSMTGAGAIAEDRLGWPVPPGTHWGDAKPVVLPEGPSSGAGGEAVKLLEDEVSRLEREKRKKKGPRGQGPRGQVEKAKPKPVRAVTTGGLHFGPVPGAPEPPEGGEGEDAAKAEAEAARAAVDAELKEAKRALRREKKKFDPAQVAFARELKDRWLEQVQREPGLLAASAAKYAVQRQIALGSSPGSTPGNHATMPGGNEAGEVRRLDAA